ncbi:MAG: globin [Candidatus Nanopelagicales bacterium]|nr:globin [Candidatus Nanopelagicales bacterium]
MTAQTPPGDTEQSLYEQFGGHDFFAALVADFYSTVAIDPVLRPLYPEEDLGPAELRLRMFFEQYWGGPSTYSEQRGHPRLRLRHGPFAIDEAARDHWLAHMRTALDKRELDARLDDEMWRYLVMAAHAMVNVHEGLRPDKPVADI